MHDAGKVILVQDVVKAYRKGGQVVMALAGVSLEANAMGMVAIVGPSGSGKSTLLHLEGDQKVATSVVASASGR